MEEEWVEEEEWDEVEVFFFRLWRMLPTMLMLGFIISVEFLFNFVCSDSLAVVALLDVFLLGCG